MLRAIRNSYYAWSIHPTFYSCRYYQTFPMNANKKVVISPPKLSAPLKVSLPKLKQKEIGTRLRSQHSTIPNTRQVATTHKMNFSDQQLKVNTIPPSHSSKIVAKPHSVEKHSLNKTQKLKKHTKLVTTETSTQEEPSISTTNQHATKHSTVEESSVLFSLKPLLVKKSKHTVETNELEKWRDHFQQHHGKALAFSETQYKTIVKEVVARKEVDNEWILPLFVSAFSVATTTATHHTAVQLFVLLLFWSTKTGNMAQMAKVFHEKQYEPFFAQYHFALLQELVQPNTSSIFSQIASFLVQYILQCIKTNQWDQLRILFSRHAIYFLLVEPTLLKTHVAKLDQHWNQVFSSQEKEDFLNEVTTLQNCIVSHAHYASLSLCLFDLAMQHDCISIMHQGFLLLKSSSSPYFDEFCTLLVTKLWRQNPYQFLQLLKHYAPIEDAQYDFYSHLIRDSSKHLPTIFSQHHFETFLLGYLLQTITWTSNKSKWYTLIMTELLRKKHNHLLNMVHVQFSNLETKDDYVKRIQQCFGLLLQTQVHKDNAEKREMEQEEEEVLEDWIDQEFRLLFSTTQPIKKDY